MPAQLPGFYFDEARNRYFPISSRPVQSAPNSRSVTEKQKVKSQATQATQANGPSRGLKRKRGDIFRATEHLRQAPSYEIKEQLTHEILCSHIASTSRATRVAVPTFGNIKSFATTAINDKCRRFIGDNRGWLYSCTTPEPSTSGIDQLVDYDTYWAAEMNVQPSSEISSISVSESHCVATCFGADGSFAVQDLNDTERTFVLTFNDVHDIWTSNLSRKALVLGAKENAIYISNVDEAHIVPKKLHTGSDVFAVTQKNDLVYTGARNGNIERFDMRLLTRYRGQQLFAERFDKRQVRSPVLHLEFVAESQVLVSQMNGDLACYDLRFSARDGASLIQYQGHVNSYTPRLGICTDLENGILFAAGQDNYIRGWSLKSGKPLPIYNAEPTIGSSSIGNHDMNPFRTVFDRAVETMQLSTEGGNKYLWAASGKELFQFHLGQRNFSFS